jgi:hypothetical protein
MHPQEPYHQYPPQYGAPFAPEQRRPAGPRVVGILGIIFATIGIGSSALFAFGPLTDVQRWGERAGTDLGTITMWLYTWMALSAVLFLLHLAGSILAITYKRLGPKLLTSYGVAALMLGILDLIMVHGFVPKHHSFDLYGSVTISHTIYEGIALVWPIIVLAIMNTRRSRAACDR